MTHLSLYDSPNLLEYFNELLLLLRRESWKHGAPDSYLIEHSPPDSYLIEHSPPDSYLVEHSPPDSYLIQQ